MQWTPQNILNMTIWHVYLDSLIRSTFWIFFCKIGFYACRKSLSAYREALLNHIFILSCTVCGLISVHFWTKKYGNINLEACFRNAKNTLLIQTKF